MLNIGHCGVDNNLNEETTNAIEINSVTPDTIFFQLHS
jgi:hypothetical protein